MKIFNYLKTCHFLLCELHRKESISLLYLWINSLYALLFHGCLIKQYVFGGIYRVKRYKMKDVMTQKRLDNIIRQYNNRRYIPLLENKKEFNTFFHQWVKRKWLHSENLSKDLFFEFAHKNNRFFVKPLSAQEGEGIKMFEHLSQQEIDSLYERIKNSHVIIEQAIKQHPNMFFGNHSVNSIRIITCMDSAGNAHILRAALRAGIGKAIVDNYSAGGVLYDIDVETGIIDNKGICNNGCHYIFHPGTSLCMLGYEIPNWNILIHEVKDAAKALPQCRFIGWDVAITESGIELIEGNHNPGLYTMESIGKPYSYRDAINYLDQ